MYLKLKFFIIKTDFSKLPFIMKKRNFQEQVNNNKKQIKSHIYLYISYAFYSDCSFRNTFLLRIKFVTCVALSALPNNA